MTQPKRPRARSAAARPQLPPLEAAETVSLRHEVNPAIALNLLGEIQQSVIRYQQELRQLVKQIRSVYAEGPVINGWLESSKPQPAARQSEAALFRHADADDLMNYLQQLESSPDLSLAADTGYQLCMIDQSGQIQSRPCPAEQVPAVSVAIARYQQIHQVVTRKQQLEQQLARLIEALTQLKEQPR
ncbi:MAG: hypothetical protein F6J97_05385 [Leptolyngbya sp. SIO4C1]|nr:hypothetical protein [Leptolyngbya sp. SIO4C1]